MARSSTLLIVLVLGVVGTQSIPKDDSNLNVNTNRFTRRNSNTNLNSNSFVRGKNGNGDDTMVDGDFDGEMRDVATCKAALVRQGIGLTTVKRSHVPTTARPTRNQPRTANPMNEDSLIGRAIQDMMGDRSGKKVANINSNTNTFGSGRNGKPSRQGEVEARMAGTMEPLDLRLAENGPPTMGPHMARDPHKDNNMNSNSNSNQIRQIPDDEYDRPMRRSHGSGPKNPPGTGQYNINSNTNQFRRGGPLDIADPDLVAARRSNSANVNTNSNTFRRSNNRNVNSNSNYYRGLEE